jgi:hypothetical protein
LFATVFRNALGHPYRKLPGTRNSTYTTAKRKDVETRMPASKKNTLRIFALIAASALAGCATGPSGMQQLADLWIGQPISAAFQTLGRPAGGHGPDPGGLGGSYQWFRSQLTPPKRHFVQTGSQYVGTSTLYQGGNPVSEEDLYAPVGYYEMRPDMKYLCDILIQTNQADIITHVSLAGCTDR